MSFTLPAASNTTGAAIPTGTYVVALKSMEREEQPNPLYGDGERCRWVFTIEQVVDSDDDAAESRIGDELWAFTSVAMTPRARMRSFVEALLGRPLDEGEQVSVADLVGKRARAVVIPHVKADGTPTTKLGTLAPYRPRRRPEPEQIDELF